MKPLNLAVRCLVLTWLLAMPLLAQDEPSVVELVEQLASSDRDARREAAHRLARYGPEAKQAVVALSQALEDDDSQVWNEATQALAHLGPPAVGALGALLEYMDSSDEQRRYRTAHALGRIGPAALPAVRERLNDDSANARESAVRALGWMGSLAVETAPDLILRLSDDNEIVRTCARESLARLGSAAVPALSDALSSEEATVKAGAAMAIADIADADDGVVHALIKMTSDEDTSVRAAAVLALGRVAGNSTTIVGPLLDALRDEAEPVQQAAVEAWLRTDHTIQQSSAIRLAALLESNNAMLTARIAVVLGSFAERANAAIPLLIDYLAHRPDATPVASAVGRIGVVAVDPVFHALRNNRLNVAQVTPIFDNMPSQVKEQLAGSLDDPSALVREIAAITISQLVPIPHTAIDRLGDALTDDHVNVRIAVARSLRTIGGRADSTLPKLIGAAKNENRPEAQVALIHAVADLQSDTGELVSFLVPYLDAKDAHLLSAALDRLGDLDELPESLYTATVAAAKHDDGSVRSSAVRAAVLVRGHRKEVAGLVVSALNDEARMVREYALRAVAKLGSEAVAAVGVIAEQLADDSGLVRIAAIESLANIGEHAQPAFERIVDLAGDADPSVRMSVIKNMREINTNPDQLLPVLITALEDEEWEVRRIAALQLGEMEEAAAPAIPALLTMLRRDDESDAARQALREINTAGDEALPLLLEIIEDETAGRRSRYYALYLLRKMGHRAEPALPILRRLRDAADGRYREYYGRAIQEIEEGEE